MNLTLKKTVLYDCHVSLGGKMVDFAGWLMPIYYSGIIAEHEWTRKSCGVFDVSHLGEIHVKGPGAFQFLQYRLTNDMAKLSNGKIIYSLLCDERALTIDDILIYQSAPDDYYLVVNASNIERDFEALSKYVPDSVVLKNKSDESSCIAIQGPKAETILEKLFGFKLRDLAYYHFIEASWKGFPVWISRSGYTGEDGFEIFSGNEHAVAIWDRLITDGKSEGVLPAGLGARNTLRLEAGNALYGHEINETTTPFDAGLGWAVAMGKPGGFIGRDMLIKQREEGPNRRLVGFKMLDKPIARDNYSIFKNEKKIGTVTSGSFGPSAGANIGLGYVTRGFQAPGTLIEIEIHGRKVPAEIVKTPFITLKHRKG